MKALIISSSDVLGMPAIIQLQQQNRLHCVAVPESAKHILIPLLKQIGIVDNDIHILTKANLTYELKTLIQHYQAQVMFTFTFAWMIPVEILSIIPNRCINFHFGLLPKYKGADPIFWQMYNREVKGGLSVHIMTGVIDGGPIILREEIPIIPGETYGMHCQSLGQLGAKNAVKVLDMLASGTPKIVAVTDGPAFALKKPSLAQLTINWQQQTAEQIEALVNASNPRYGGAVTSIRQMEIRILEISPVDINNPERQQFTPGAIVHADALHGLIIACVNNQFIKLNITQLQEGYFTGAKLFAMGFGIGEVFGI
jgi:methionyl-tRNA formyltransferase